MLVHTQNDPSYTTTVAHGVEEERKREKGCIAYDVTLAQGRKSTAVIKSSNLVNKEWKRGKGGR